MHGLSARADVKCSQGRAQARHLAGQVVIRRQLKRRYILALFQKLPPCLVGIEACGSFTNGRASSRHLAIRCD